MHKAHEANARCRQVPRKVADLVAVALEFRGAKVRNVFGSGRGRIKVCRQLELIAIDAAAATALYKGQGIAQVVLRAYRVVAGNAVVAVAIKP